MTKLNLIGAQPFETKRCRLRSFKKGDEKFIYNNWASNDNVTKYLTWNTHKTPEDSRLWCECMVEESAKLDSFRWGIELAETGELIGQIDVVALDKDKGVAELGWCIGEKWWNKGIMTECAEAVLAYLIFVIGFSQVRACHDVDNLASCRVMEKVGLRYNGERQCEVPLKGITVTVKDYSITNEQWYSDNIRLRK